MITKLSISLLTLLLFITGCEKKSESNEPSTSKHNQTTTQPKPATNSLTLTDTSGKTYILNAAEERIIFDGLEDKVIMLDFFATWCPPCRAEMPHLVHLQEKYKGKIQILSVLMEEEKDNDEAIAFGKEYHVNFPILNSKENFMLSQALGGIRSLPTLVMYDTKGNYFTHYTGLAPEEMIESDIKKALAK